MLTPYDRDYDYLDLEDDSDQEKAESSDDDIDILLFGTPEQKRKLYKRSKGDKSSSEDDFEKEMNAELKSKVKAIETTRKRLGTDDDVQPGISGVDSLNKDGSTEEPQKYYDDVYFDSDEEDMVAQDLDDEDQHWVDQQKESYRVKQPESKDEGQGKVKPVPSSDAVLNCPACMTTLCLDCQRHEMYMNQYRAMFVMNCVVDNTERLKFPKGSAKERKRKRKKQMVSNSLNANLDEEEDWFNPVKCSECSTVVAVYDDDEVYHFFNVLASYA
ncbi:hypothetical protein CHS0354_020410 [Potamilus streckersoni]|uniref:E2F-associated phosphoprotein n=1 Tax=Potamilus streckersoni TaxID=2493646 RepID=A0AAE0W321_9BIVA|nr:hypothetical protein CHS0354_020410 [Potamilus streckersoni]